MTIHFQAWYTRHWIILLGLPSCLMQNLAVCLTPLSPAERLETVMLKHSSSRHIFPLTDLGNGAL